MTATRLPSSVPSTGNALTRGLGRLLMRLSGWRFKGNFPDLPRFVVIIAPHTSNWDFFVGVMAKLALSLDVVWIGKHSLFRWPVGVFLKRIGGIPVHRETPHDVVQRIVDEFAARKRMVFGLAPEGTRKRVERWRSGYWHVAHRAQLPIVPVGFDYANKTILIAEPHPTSDSLEADEEELRAFFSTVTGRVPENYAA